VEQVRVELRSSKAVVVLVAVLGVSGYRGYSRFRTVDVAGRNALRSWLVNDYEGRGSSGMERRRPVSRRFA
jgi:hypothetical protein